MKLISRFVKMCDNRIPRIILWQKFREINSLLKTFATVWIFENFFPHDFLQNFVKVTSLLEMIHFTGDICEKLVPQHLLPFYLSIIFHFSRQKLVLRQLFSESRFQIIFFCKWVGYQPSLFDSITKCYHQKVCNFPLGKKIKISC